MRTAEEIFQNHFQSFGAGKIEAILEDYDDNSVIIYRDRSWLGIKGAKEFFTMWLDD